MMRIGLFVAILVLVCPPLVRLQAEGGDPTTSLIDAPTLERWTEGVAAFTAKDFGAPGPERR